MKIWPEELGCRLNMLHTIICGQINSNRYSLLLSWTHCIQNPWKYRENLGKIEDYTANVTCALLGNSSIFRGKKHAYFWAKTNLEEDMPLLPDIWNDFRPFLNFLVKPFPSKSSSKEAKGLKSGTLGKRKFFLNMNFLLDSIFFM